jgi:hypothetical protein
MSTLPYRRHGGRRLHRATQSLSGGSRYIMTPDQRANRTSLRRPPDRDGAARSATATRRPDHGQNSQTPTAMTARRPDCLGASLQSAGPNAPMAQRQRRRRHSNPIALAARGAAAESARGVSPRAAHRSGLDTLASSGSCHRTKAAALRRELELILLPVGSLPTPMTCSLCSAGITPLHHYYGAVRP